VDTGVTQALDYKNQNSHDQRCAQGDTQPQREACLAKKRTNHNDGQ
jgi:hypothetical protein